MRRLLIVTGILSLLAIPAGTLIGQTDQPQSTTSAPASTPPPAGPDQKSSTAETPTPPPSTPGTGSAERSVAPPATPPSSSKADEYTSDMLIRSDVRRVLLDVSVKNSNGEHVAGLTKDNFHVFEDGKPQQIVEFAAGDIPVTIGLLVDESLSMRPKRAQVLTAAMSFLHESNPADEMFVLNFNETVRHGLPDTELFSGNINELRKALFAGQPEGRTALYDAVVEGLKQLDMGRQAKKAIVLISDGGDNVSTHHLNDVMRLTEKTSATIYTVGIFDPDDKDKNPDLLSKLAHVSGGVAYFPENTGDIIPVCEKIAKEIRNRYTLSYVPAEGMGKEKLRHIRVEVSAPEHGKLVARTRTSYLYIPDEAESANQKQ